MSIRKQPEPAKGAKRLSWKANLLFAAVVLAAAVLLVFLLRPRSKTEPLAAVVDFGGGITEVLPLDKELKTALKMRTGPHYRPKGANLCQTIENITTSN